MSESRNWARFWDQPHAIYVNQRHLDTHCRDIADGIVELLPAPNARVLDHGCGESVHADVVAAAAKELLLCDAAGTVREHLKARYAGDPKIRVLTPEEVERLPDASLDLVVANSLVQYLSPGELDRLLAVWRRALAPGGVLVVADVIPPDVGPISDALALLRYAARNGFLVAALIGIVRTAFSRYRKMRAALGFTRYSQAEFMTKLRAQGFEAERLPYNLEHNPARMTFRARPV
jgi:SAM-dependent methyltransferase